MRLSVHSSAIASVLCAAIASFLMCGCKEEKPERNVESRASALPSGVFAGMPPGEASGAAAKDPKQQQKDKVLQLFKATDLDGDGKITPREAEEHGTKNFNSLDKNGNGMIDVSEMTAPLEAFIMPRVKRQIAAWDKNGDGKVTRDELAKPLEERFDDLDTNRDGVLAAEELVASQKTKMQSFSPLAHLDTNGDGIITLEEYNAGRIKWFEKADVNADGVVTLEEAEKAVPDDRQRALEELRRLKQQRRR